MGNGVGSIYAFSIFFAVLIGIELANGAGSCSHALGYCKFFSWEQWSSWTRTGYPNSQIRLRFFCCPPQVTPVNSLNCITNCSITTPWKETRPCPHCAKGKSISSFFILQLTCRKRHLNSLNDNGLQKWRKKEMFQLLYYGTKNLSNAKSFKYNRIIINVHY